MHDGHHHHHSHERKTRWVTLLTAVTMILELTVGYYTGSMALFAEGWHMSTHVLALGMSWVAYRLIRRYTGSERLTFNTDKLLALSGFTSALLLQVVAFLMAVESIQRLIQPVPIRFSEAIAVAIIGAIVNGISAIVLHHEEEEADHNIRAAYVHVLADGVTSLIAIGALTAGMLYHLYSLDAISGIIGSVVVTSWAISLIKHTSRTLIELRKK